MADARPKLFVLDTNVILHDSGCLRKFAEHDVAVPITVLGIAATPALTPEPDLGEPRAQMPGDP